MLTVHSAEQANVSPTVGSWWWPTLRRDNVYDAQLVEECWSERKSQAPAAINHVRCDRGGLVTTFHRRRTASDRRCREAAHLLRGALVDLRLPAFGAVVVRGLAGDPAVRCAYFGQCRGKVAGVCDRKGDIGILRRGR